jgi:hypothetical protein
MGARTVWPRMALSISTYIYILKYGGPPADGGHPGERRTGGHPGGRRTGGRYTTDGNTCAMGEGRIRREPQRGGREDVSATVGGWFTCVSVSPPENLKDRSRPHI